MRNKEEILKQAKNLFAQEEGWPDFDTMEEVVVAPIEKNPVLFGKCYYKAMLTASLPSEEEIEEISYLYSTNSFYQAGCAIAIGKGYKDGFKAAIELLTKGK